MAEESVLKEFLVSLGFKVDEPGLKKFTDGVEQTTKVALSTGKAVLGVGLAAQAMVVNFSNAMEKLYYSSRRTGAAVENIQALEFGSRKVGIAAGVAQAALEQMTAAARVNPGLRGLMDQMLGKSTAGMDQATVMIDLVQKLSDLPHHQGAAFAGMFGIDEKTFLMMKQGMPELLAAEKERLALNKNLGLDMQEAARAGMEYANSLRDITERVSVLSGKLSVELLPAFRLLNKEITSGLDNLAKFEISKYPRTQAALSAAGQVASGVIGLDANQVDIGLKNLLKNSPAAAITRGVVDWREGARAEDAKTPLLTPQQRYDAAMKEAARVAALPPGPRYQHNGLIGSVWDWASDKYTGLQRQARGQQPLPPRIPMPVAPTVLPKLPPVQETPRAGPAGPNGVTGNTPLGVRQNNPGNLRNWDGVPSQNGFANFGTAQEGLSAMAANLVTYYTKYGARNVNDIAKKWAPSHENDTAGYAAAISDRLGVKGTDQLNLKDPAVLAKVMDAMIKQEQGYNPYGAHELVGAARSRTAAPAVLEQKTDIHVHGQTDPRATAAEIERAQRGVNADAIRNLKGATR